MGIGKRHVALLRVLQIADILSSRRATVRELATECGVHSRTIYRDLEVLSLAGFPVRSTAEGSGGFWFIERELNPHLATASARRHLGRTELPPPTT